ncbi:Coiled-coil domain-containing 7A [Apodemus speciosus]|uniref:Coiled-coil domain-containing 7A n=1 Tax=Apodemus speciosus TaxID=105296 RepID=A0ABQ0F444_APOSI
MEILNFSHVIWKLNQSQKMKRAKHPSTVSMKLTSIPELPYKKGPLNSSPKPKEKRNAKSTQEKIEPMVIRSPPTGESIVRYALPIPSTMMKDLVSDAEMVRMIAKNLKTLPENKISKCQAKVTIQAELCVYKHLELSRTKEGQNKTIAFDISVVSALEETYGALTDDGEKAAEKSEAEGLSVGDDMNSFLLCCSQFAAQLEEAVKEERGILESLFKWFQQQVNQMEEISKDQSNLQADLPSDDKFVNKGITQIAKLIHKFEDIRGRLKERRVSLQSKKTTGLDKELLSEALKHYGLIEQQIEEFIKSHSALASQEFFETESEF